MQRQGVTDSVSLQSSLHSSFINEFNAIQQALNSEIDFVLPRSSPYLPDSASRSDVSNEEDNNTQYIGSDPADEQCESDSVEVVRPPNARTLPVEDPIETYDLIIDEMKSSGIQWVPADQMNKSLSEVRIAAPDGQSLQSAVTPTNSSSQLTTNRFENGNNGRQQHMNEATTIQRPTSDIGDDQSAAENARKLRELQNQLNQEKATRKQQEDYIQQLQHYYDNLLAKHAAAEMTIDHFRFRNQVDPTDATSPTKTPSSNPNTPNLSTSLRERKLTSASVDVCSSNPLLSRSIHHQSRTTGSLMTLREDEFPDEKRPVTKRTSLVTPKVHLMSLSSISQHPLEVELDQQYNIQTPYKPAVGMSGGDNGSHNANSSLNDSRGDLRGVNRVHQRSGSNVDMATQEAARTLEGQLASSIAAIHERLDAIEAHLLGDQRNEALAAIKSELEDLSRRYRAGLYLWSEKVFDGNTVVASRLNHLTQRLERVASLELEDAVKATTTPARPSSLSLVDTHRPNSMESNPSTSSIHANSLSRQGSVSSPLSAHPNASVGVCTSNGERGSSSTPTSTDSSLESAESHFVRLLSRYNKLKVIPGHSKDVESLMQRMLQLSDRYSSQSTVIFPPKSLRQMFESDYTIKTGTNESLFADHQVFTKPLSTKMMNEVSTKHRQMISPDSGVAQTPLGSSGSSGTSCYVVAAPSRTIPLVGNFGETSNFFRPKSATPSTLTHGTLAGDTERKQSDSGVWVTESYSAVQAPTYKSSNVHSVRSIEHSEEVDVDSNAGRPSKMLPDEVMSLEADIKRLREGIARLTTSTSVSSGPLYRGDATKSDSSSSTCEEQPRRKSSRRQTLGSNRKSHTLSSPSKRTSLTQRQPRLPSSSSSSSLNDEGRSAFSPYVTRPRYPQPSRSRNRRSLNPCPSQSLEVIGSPINPLPRNPTPGQNRVYSRRNSSTSRGGPGEFSSVSHRRSRSTTGRTRSYYHPCGSCGGSGYNINVVGREQEVAEFAYEPPGHTHTISDTYTMPTRVIYEYSRQGPVIRLPVHDCGGWTERVYGMKEIYGSSVSPQTGRAYNTIGHQPSTNLNPNRPTWDSPGRQPGMKPATSSTVIPQRSSRKTRQYMPSVGSNSLFCHHSQLEDTFSSASDDAGEPPRDVAVLPTLRSFRRNTHRSRRRSSSRHLSTEQEGFSSSATTGIDAFSTARSVTQMAHQLNNNLSRHQEYREYAPRQQQSFQPLSSSSSVRHSSRSRRQRSGTYLTTMLDDIDF